MKILDVSWFCGTTNVGIVRVQDPHDGIKYYISSVSGTNEEHDIEFIAAYGTPFPNEVGDVLFGVI